MRAKFEGKAARESNLSSLSTVHWHVFATVCSHIPSTGGMRLLRKAAMERARNSHPFLQTFILCTIFGYMYQIPNITIEFSRVF